MVMKRREENDMGRFKSTSQSVDGGYSFGGWMKIFTNFLLL